jgi:hypothetical protein
MNDLKIMSDRWLWSAGEHPPIAVNITSDPNNLTSDVPIRINGLPNNITKGFIYVDGELNEYIDYMMLPEEANNCTFLDTKKISNGQHNIKVATVDINGLITMSEATTVDVNNELYYVTKGLYFEPNDGYPVYAMSDTNSNFRVRLARWDGNTIWTSDASSGGLNVTVPSSVLTGQIYKIVLEIDTNEPSSWRTLCEEPSKSRRRRPGPYKVAIFLPNGRLRDSHLPTSDSRWRAVEELIRWCEEKDMKYVILYRGECTWEGFSSVLSMPSVSYVYHVSIGDYFINYGSQTLYRLSFFVSGSLGLGTERVFSHTDGLPEKVARRSHSMYSLGLHLSSQIRLVYMTVCYQGISTEMAEQWLDWDWLFPPGQLFCGWRDEALDNLYWKEWDYDFWHYFGSGDHDAWWVYTRIQLPDENLFGDEIALEFELRGDQSVTFTTTGNQ